MDELVQALPEMAPFVSAFMVGLLGGMHCIGMCGGIMGALSFSVPREANARRLGILLSYNLGRIGSYAMIGLLVGALSYQVSGGHGLSVLRVIAGLLLVAMGLYLADWWRGLTYLERGGAVVWRYVQPLGKRLMPVKGPAPALLLGMVWGWLPCGLVYSALAYAAAQANPLGAAGIMLAFGLGTLPMVLASGIFAERIKNLLQLKSLRVVMALAVIGFGLWTLWVPYQHSQMDHGSMDHGSMDHGSMDHGSMDHGSMDHRSMDHSTMDHSTMDHGAMNHGAMDHNQMNHKAMDHSKMDHSQVDHARTDQQSEPEDHSAHQHMNHH